ncbi:MAG: hypothetical protein KDA28_06135, partial [Phycisphaerales bacterium]|nr:hypothetical protein [Phycisphaerales bacterium]
LVMDQATHLAHLATEAAPDVDERVRLMYRRVIGRTPTSEEASDAAAFVEMQIEAYDGDEARAWADFGHVLFNLKEFIFID